MGHTPRLSVRGHWSPSSPKRAEDKDHAQGGGSEKPLLMGSPWIEQLPEAPSKFNTGFLFVSCKCKLLGSNMPPWDTYERLPFSPSP